MYAMSHMSCFDGRKGVLNLALARSCLALPETASNGINKRVREEQRCEERCMASKREHLICWWIVTHCGSEWHGGVFTRIQHC